MVTFAQAQERAEEWINGDVPAHQHREVRVREFELGFVAWAEDRDGVTSQAGGPGGGATSDGGRQRLVIARDSGEATLWPGLPVGEVIRRYEEEYGSPPGAAPGEGSAGQPERIDLNQTSFLLTPPEWLQNAADKLGVPGRGEPAAAGGDAGAEPSGRSGGSGDSVTSGASGDSGASGTSGTPAPFVTSGSGIPGPGPGTGGSAPGAGGGDVWSAPAVPADGGSRGGTAWPSAGSGAGAPGGDGDDGSVPLPATVFAPPLSGADDEDTPLPAVGADAPTALMSGGSQLPRTTLAPALDPDGPPGPGGPQGPTGPATGEAGPAPDAAPGRPAGGPATPPPPGVPGAPGALPPASGPGVPGTPAGGYVPTRLVPHLGGPEGPQPPGPPGAPQPPGPPGPPPPPGATPPPGGGVHHAATMLAQPGPGGPAGPGAPQPPGPPGAPQPPGAPGMPGAPGAGAHHAETMLAQPGPGRPVPPPAPAPAPAGPPMPGPRPPAYGYPQQPPTGVPTVGPGYQAVLRYRAPDGSEAQLIRRSAPGTPHPEWQILHELRAMNVPPQQVLELHTELASCELPGGYCARMIREIWPQARITSIAPYGRDHASRQQGMAQLLAHQGELHQVADGPARPAPVRAPLPPVQPAPPIPPEGIAQELAGAFGPQGICRFDQRAVSRQGVPELVARTLVWAGLPADFGPFFWAQPAQPVVPTLAELAAQRQVQPAADAGSYLVVGSDFGRAVCVQYGTAHIVAVPVEAGPGGQPVAPQFVNSGLPEFTRCLALLGRMWRLRFGLTPEQAGRWTVDFQAQLAMLDPAALSSPESWWSVLLEQMWDGLL
ncbi:SUKH-4 family immunity protein [Streptomyces sp. NPDC050856]|uniref:SUKH-4 family immunity protein n=1 Tax=Streptomyces sp. NPDC050856 TaxID=3154939 RepID=UPI00340F26A8